MHYKLTAYAIDFVSFLLQNLEKPNKIKKLSYLDQ